MASVSFYTLGCKLNYAETSTLTRDFEAHDYAVVPYGQVADITVINTCTVTEEAERKCRQIIRRSQRLNPDTFILVTGCYAQLRPETIASIPGVDAVLGAQEKFNIFQLIDSFSKTEQTQVKVSCIDDISHFGPAYSSGERTRAFLKVQDGCDYTCSFCTIPLARGKSRSQSTDVAVRQAEEIAARGYKEIVLTGVNIGLFGQDNGTSLLALLQALDQVEGIERYRISSIEPNLLTEEIIAFVASSKRFMPHFHIPLQSGDDYVLGKMRRRYQRDLYANRVATIKAHMPHACIGVDVIVGFPAETEDHFENTYRFLNDLDISYLHVFTYSERPDTVAVDKLKHMGGVPVPKAERSRRNKMLRILSEKKRHAFYATHLGESRAVLWEGAERNGRTYGFTDNYIKVQQAYDASLEGCHESVMLDHIVSDGTVAVQSAAFISLL